MSDRITLRVVSEHDVDRDRGAEFVLASTAVSERVELVDQDEDDVVVLSDAGEKTSIDELENRLEDALEGSNHG